MYYLYKLYHPKSGLYYIGVTVNLEARKSQHLSNITTLLRFARRHKVKNGNMYYRFAKEVIKGKNTLRVIMEKDMARNEMKFRVLLQFETAEEAKFRENEYITALRSDPKFLNDMGKSCYYHKKKINYA